MAWRGIEYLPWLYAPGVSRLQAIERWRPQLVGKLGGRVLEIGTGTGANLPYYDPGTHLIASEFDRTNLAYFRQHAPRPLPPLVQADAQSLPFADHSFDHVVCTLVLCSVADQASTLAEIRRVLRPSGHLHLIEHTRTDAAWLNAMLGGIAPLWRWLAGGCNVIRPTPTTLTTHGWTLLHHERRYAGFLRLLVVQPPPNA